MDSWCWSLDPGQWSDKKKRPSLKKRRSKIKFPGKSDCIWWWGQRCQCHVSMTSEQWICSKAGRTDTWMFFWSFTCWFLFSHQKTETWLFFLSFFQCWFLFSHPWTPCPGGFQACKVRFQSEQFQRCPMGEIQTGAKWVKRTKWVKNCSLKKSQAGGSESFLYFRYFHHLHYFLYSRMAEVQPLNLFWPWKTAKRTLFGSSFIFLNISFPNFPFQRGWKSDQDVSGSQEVSEAAYTHSSQK